MARHKLTKADKIKGIKKAIASKKTPSRLKPSMKKYLQKLEGK